jgi:hypothetical protein
LVRVQNAKKYFYLFPASPHLPTNFFSIFFFFILENSLGKPTLRQSLQVISGAALLPAEGAFLS